MGLEKLYPWRLHRALLRLAMQGGRTGHCSSAPVLLPESLQIQHVSEKNKLPQNLHLAGHPFRF